MSRYDEEIAKNDGEIAKLRNQLSLQKKIKNARINNLLRENKDLRQTIFELRSRITQLETPTCSCTNKCGDDNLIDGPGICKGLPQ